MKRVFYLLVFTAFLGCNKSNPDPTPTASLSFKADGVVHSYTGDWNGLSLTGCSLEASSISLLGYFMIVGVGTQSSDGFEAHVHATSVATGTYNTVEFEGFLGGVHYQFSLNCVVTISKIENGRATGTFSGKMAQNGSTPFVMITDGVFTDVPIR